MNKINKHFQDLGEADSNTISLEDFETLMEKMGTTYCAEEHGKYADQLQEENKITKEKFSEWYLQWLFDDDDSDSDSEEEDTDIAASKGDAVSQMGWGNLFQAAEGSWTCNVCLVKNPVTAEKKCMACGSVREGYEEEEEEKNSAATKGGSFGSGGFVFGNTTSSTGGFQLDVTGASTKVSQGTTAAESNAAQDAKNDASATTSPFGSGFQFGPSKPATAPPTFGSSSSTTSTGGFQFGVTGSSAKGLVNIMAAKSDPAQDRQKDTSAATSAFGSGFQFGPSKPTAATPTFGSGNFSFGQSFSQLASLEKKEEDTKQVSSPANKGQEKEKDHFLAKNEDEKQKETSLFKIGDKEEETDRDSSDDDDDTEERQEEMNKINKHFQDLGEADSNTISLEDFETLMEKMGTTYCAEEHGKYADQLQEENKITKEKFSEWYLQWLFDDDDSDSDSEEEDTDIAASKGDAVSQMGWGNLFQAAEGSWTCNVCLVKNPVTAEKKCMACGSVREGYEEEEEEKNSAATKGGSFGSGGFVFGNTTSSTGGFQLDVTGASTKVSQGTTAAESNAAQDAKNDASATTSPFGSGFQFGPSKPATAPPTFGSSSSTTSTGGFQFGVTGSSAKGLVNIMAAKSDPAQDRQKDTSAATSAFGSGFQFGPSKPTAATPTFGSGNFSFGQSFSQLASLEKKEEEKSKGSGSSDKSTTPFKTALIKAPSPFGIASKPDSTKSTALAPVAGGFPPMATKAPTPFGASAKSDSAKARTTASKGGGFPPMATKAPTPFGAAAKTDSTKSTLPASGAGGFPPMATKAPTPFGTAATSSSTKSTASASASTSAGFPPMATKAPTPFGAVAKPDITKTTASRAFPPTATKAPTSFEAATKPDSTKSTASIPATGGFPPMSTKAPTPFGTTAKSDSAMVTKTPTPFGMVAKSGSTKSTTSSSGGFPPMATKAPTPFGATAKSGIAKSIASASGGFPPMATKAPTPFGAVTKEDSTKSASSTSTAGGFPPMSYKAPTPFGASAKSDSVKFTSLAPATGGFPPMATKAPTLFETVAKTDSTKLVKSPTGGGFPPMAAKAPTLFGASSSGGFLSTTAKTSSIFVGGASASTPDRTKVPASMSSPFSFPSTSSAAPTFLGGGASKIETEKPKTAAAASSTGGFPPMSSNAPTLFGASVSSSSSSFSGQSSIAPSSIFGSSGSGPSGFMATQKKDEAKTATSVTSSGALPPMCKAEPSPFGGGGTCTTQVENLSTSTRASSERTKSTSSSSTSGGLPPLSNKGSKPLGGMGSLTARIISSVTTKQEPSNKDSSKAKILPKITATSEYEVQVWNIVSELSQSIGSIHEDYEKLEGSALDIRSFESNLQTLATTIQQIKDDATATGEHIDRQKQDAIFLLSQKDDFGRQVKESNFLLNSNMSGKDDDYASQPLDENTERQRRCASSKVSRIQKHVLRLSERVQLMEHLYNLSDQAEDTRSRILRSPHAVMARQGNSSKKALSSMLAYLKRGYRETLATQKAVEELKKTIAMCQAKTVQPTSSYGMNTPRLLRRATEEPKPKKTSTTPKQNLSLVSPPFSSRKKNRGSLAVLARPIHFTPKQQSALMSPKASSSNGHCTPPKEYQKLSFLDKVSRNVERIADVIHHISQDSDSIPCKWFMHAAAPFHPEPKTTALTTMTKDYARPPPPQNWRRQSNSRLMNVPETAGEKSLVSLKGSTLTQVKGNTFSTGARPLFASPLSPTGDPSYWNKKNQNLHQEKLKSVSFVLPNNDKTIDITSASRELLGKYWFSPQHLEISTH